MQPKIFVPNEQQSNEWWCGKIVRQRQAIYFSKLKEKLKQRMLTGTTIHFTRKVEDANGENVFYSFQTTKRPCFNIACIN
ncbi:hypothetical protein T07_1521 [Trichinella nelsoni]|uniref:Uncharacterized protein n=1 Tax=Trichinella nelsoni TaxID=6336 RepID=A0A0V0SI24_9BILA|nr:hypothetical protein T07_1521 [Trichinella nelsoni]